MKVLITAGPTQEHMDPVRFLTNASSGAMGFAIAEAFQRKRAQVTVVFGPTALKPPAGVRSVPVISAREMNREVQKRLASTDLLVATAAVSDFRFEKMRSKKMKKGAAKSWAVRLVQNPDILFQAGRWKKNKKSALKLVGFALETDHVARSMAQKMKKKNLDLIIGNSPASFGGSMIQPLWLERQGKTKRFPKMTKRRLGQLIAQWAQ